MLKACPFCGKVPDRVERWESLTTPKVYYMVGCNNPRCKIQPTTVGYTFRQNAVNAWNKRGLHETINYSINGG